jgi:hypothetical protein
MFFRMNYILHNLPFKDDTKSVDFQFGQPPIHLRIARITTEELGPDTDETDYTATLSTQEDVSEKVAGLFDQDSTEPHPAVKECTVRVSSRLHAELYRVLRLLRWRLGDFKHAHPEKDLRRFEWSVDQAIWKPARGHVKLMFLPVGFGYFPLDDKRLPSIREMVANGTREPLAHEMLREAAELMRDYPRSALVTAISAAEIGCKEMISALVPDAEWLAMHAPTPPLVQMLEEYVPKLPLKQLLPDGSFVPQSLIKTLRKGVRLRNEAIHRGSSVKFDSLEEILDAVHQLLYLIDVFKGHQWATDKLTPITLGALK